jgi:hypothetical protein
MIYKDCIIIFNEYKLSDYGFNVLDDVDYKKLEEKNLNWEKSLYMLFEMLDYYKVEQIDELIYMDKKSYICFSKKTIVNLLNESYKCWEKNKK